jgi:hypothetical protein
MFARFNKIQLAKAALFTAAMWATEKYISDISGHHHYRHHHHHRNVEQEMAHFIVTITSYATTALVASVRFGASNFTHNNSIAMGITEFGVNYLFSGGNMAAASIFGIFGAGVATAINTGVDKIAGLAQPAARPHRS